MTMGQWLLKRAVRVYPVFEYFFHPAVSGPVRRPSPKHQGRYKEVTGYRIQASDGQIGHVEDFLVNDEAWSLRYIQET
jgi:hypothetical protein